MRAFLIQKQLFLLLFENNMFTYLKILNQNTLQNEKIVKINVGDMIQFLLIFSIKGYCLIKTDNGEIMKVST